ncbi:transglycosylase domain-containing protein [Micromonospora sp. NPDC049559]|uniref:transglycosylase domain-containing protein n=1 Tax=Micromonospora sp. NPDC049559 TaxID=3155923 RepID=UPI003439F67B
MNSYGDPGSPRGRARIPGTQGDPGPAADDSYRRAAPGGGSGGGRGGDDGSAAPRAASRGRASVGKASPVGPGPAGAGRAPVGPPASGSARVGRAGAGRATVGTASVGTVGRASVAAPVPPAGPGGSGPDGPSGSGSGRPRGSGPGRRGRAAVADGPDARAKARRRRRLNWIIASCAAFVMLAGVGVVGFTYYSTTVVLPESYPLPLSTTVYARDGRTELAKLGEWNREFVTGKQIPLHVQHAVAAAEDRNYYEHSGVDYVGIARAAWNNLTGGDKQGASTITQQYARNYYPDLKQDSYARKAKEAVIALKLTDKYDKQTIMQHYLNVIPFGRGAYGIQAAARAYFGKDVGKLTVAESAVLAAVIRQPDGAYDPAYHPEAAKDRWNYVLNGMIEKKWLKPAERPTQYPQVVAPKTDATIGVNTPKGNVVNYVRDEMKRMGLCVDGARDNPRSCWAQLADGGYKITTTIDPKMQAAAEAAARQAQKGSVLYDQPKNLMAAIVAIDPKTGQVLAYYGGDSGADIDYAGVNTIGGRLTGGHPPGSSFKVYTLTAAIDSDVSVESHWDARNFKPEGFADEITNAGRDVSRTCGSWCTLRYATEQSYNVPFYHVTEKIGPAKVVDIAKAAGVNTMWTVPAKGDPEAIDLTRKKGEDVAPAPFYHVVGYGQYPITVLDHANGLATLAAGGMYNKAHFVVKIEKQNQDTGKWEKKGGEQLKPQRRIKKSVADQVTAVLKKIPGINHHDLASGREAAGKTGTWQYGNTKHNSNAWMVGYTPQIATAVWVGSKDPKKPEILDKGRDDIGGSGLPADIWKRFMDAALKGKEEVKLPDVVQMGDESVGNGVEPVQQQPSPGQCAALDPFCVQQPGPNNPNQPGGPNQPVGPGVPNR